MKTPANNNFISVKIFSLLQKIKITGNIAAACTMYFSRNFLTPNNTSAEVNAEINTAVNNKNIAAKIFLYLAKINFISSFLKNSRWNIPKSANAKKIFPTAFDNGKKNEKPHKYKNVRFSMSSILENDIANKFFTVLFLVVE